MPSQISDILIDSPMATRLLLETQLLKLSLRDYVESAWDVLRPGIDFLPNWHIDLICEYLTAVTDGEINRLVLNLPPRYMKSLLVSVLWPTWEWIRFPHYRYLFVSYSQSLSTDHSVDRRSLLQSDWYRERFGDAFQLTTDQNVKIQYANSRNGQMVASSVGGTATGKGGQRVIIDDPQNPEQAESEVERLAADRFFNRTLSTRLDNKRTGAFVVVMQRLHQADITARCKELGYVVVKIPGIATKSTVVRFPKSGREFVREPGDLLWPEREGWKEIREAEIQLTPYGFAGQYQQDPIPAGGQIFEVDKIKIVPSAPRFARRARFWDNAATEGGGAFTVGLLMSRTQDGRLFVEDIVRGQWSPGVRETTIRQTTILDMARFPRNYRVYIEEEPGASGKHSAQISIKNLPAGVIAKACPPERSGAGKLGRARGFATQVGISNVFMVAAPWNHEYLEELRYFPNSRFKDQVDASSGAYLKLAKGRSSQSYDAA